MMAVVHGSIVKVKFRVHHTHWCGGMSNRVWENDDLHNAFVT
jgi:hypothetical protein